MFLSNTQYLEVFKTHMGKKFDKSVLKKFMAENFALICILLVSLVIRLMFSVDNAESLFIYINLTRMMPSQS